MDKGYENASERYQVKYSVGRQVSVDGLKVRYWVQDSWGTKVTVSTSDINKAQEEADAQNAKQ